MNILLIFLILMVDVRKTLMTTWIRTYKAGLIQNDDIRLIYSYPNKSRVHEDITKASCLNDFPSDLKLIKRNLVQHIEASVCTCHIQRYK